MSLHIMILYFTNWWQLIFRKNRYNLGRKNIRIKISTTACNCSAPLSSQSSSRSCVPLQPHFCVQCIQFLTVLRIGKISRVKFVRQEVVPLITRFVFVWTFFWTIELFVNVTWENVCVAHSEFFLVIILYNFYIFIRYIIDNFWSVFSLNPFRSWKTIKYRFHLYCSMNINESRVGRYRFLAPRFFRFKKPKAKTCNFRLFCVFFR